MLLSAIHKLINSVWNKEELPDQWKESVTIQLNEKYDEIDCNNYLGILQNVFEYPPHKFRSIRRRNYLGSSVWDST
jgi:hypothetical protein